MTDKPARPKPPPLTPTQKWGFSACVGVGLVVLVIGMFFLPDTFPSFASGAIIGAGSSLTAIGLLMLFYRPDRGPRAR